MFSMFYVEVLLSSAKPPKVRVLAREGVGAVGVCVDVCALSEMSVFITRLRLHHAVLIAALSHKPLSTAHFD